MKTVADNPFGEDHASFLRRFKLKVTAGAAGVIVGVPVAASPAVALLERVTAKVVALHTPYPFYAVGMYYTDFGQVSDAEVLDALAAPRQGENGEPSSDV